MIAHQARKEPIEAVLVGVALDLGLAEVDTDVLWDDDKATKVRVSCLDGEN